MANACAAINHHHSHMSQNANFRQGNLGTNVDGFNMGAWLGMPDAWTYERVGQLAR